MFYGVEQTTDMRYPETKIVKFRSKTTALKWESKGGGYAWKGAADETLPTTQQNFHRRLRSIYETPKGWRPPSKKELTKMTHELSTTTHTVTIEEALVICLACDKSVVVHYV